MRGDVHRVRPAKREGREQRGVRYAIVVQSDDLPLSTVVVAPTSTSCRPTSFRPKVSIKGSETYVMVEQLSAVDWERLGEPVDRVTSHEMGEINEAIDLVLDRDLRA